MKLESEDIIEEIADDLIIYLKAGEINVNSFIKKLDFNVNNLKQLLRIHFILHEDVIDFVKALPKNLRSIKTTTKKVAEIFNGKIKGRIDWQGTFKARYKQNFLDKTIFSCIQKDKDINIKENLVLKKLLNIIVDILSEDIDFNKDYNWYKEWGSQEKLFYRLKDVYSKNIYLNKIDIDNINITTRMINDTKRSRNKFYRRAAKLLSLYKKISTPSYWYEEKIIEEIKEMLRNTFILPQNEDVLFELYWVFKFLEKYEGTKRHIIDGHTNIVASWEDKYHYYNLYHDSDGSHLINFKISLNEIKGSNNEYLKRMYSVRKSYIKYAKEIFDDKKSRVCWQGRPDIILEMRDKRDNKLKKLYIGEVKNTSKKGYAEEGLKELLEYIGFVKDSMGYLNDNNLNNSSIVGMLMLNNIKIKSTKYKNIEIYVPN